MAISNKADLWRPSSKLSDLFDSVTGCPGWTAPGSRILGRLGLSSLWILPPSLIPPHTLGPFTALIQFLTCTGTEKTVWCSCFLHLLRLYSQMIIIFLQACCLVCFGLCWASPHLSLLFLTGQTIWFQIITICNQADQQVILFSSFLLKGPLLLPGCVFRFFFLCHFIF